MSYTSTGLTISSAGRLSIHNSVTIGEMIVACWWWYLDPWGSGHISGCEGETGASGTTSGDDVCSLSIQHDCSFWSTLVILDSDAGNWSGSDAMGLGLTEPWNGSQTSGTDLPKFATALSNTCK